MTHLKLLHKLVFTRKGCDMTRKTLRWCVLQLRFKLSTFDIKDTYYWSVVVSFSENNFFPSGRVMKSDTPLKNFDKT